MKADETIDCAGLFCPMPIAHTRVKIDEMKKGQVLEVLADDPGFEKDFPEWCKASEQEFLGLEKEDGIFKGYVRKK